VGLLIALCAVLLPGWATTGQTHFRDVVAEMYNFRLLPALGFALALRFGAIDLSVWSLTALGGVLAAVAGQHGLGPGASLLVGTTAGLSVGMLHALATVVLRVPSFVITLATGVAIFFGLNWTFAGPVVSPPEGLFSSWGQLVPVGPAGTIGPWSGRPPFVLGVALVLLAYGAAMIFILVVSLISGETHKPLGTKKQAIALAACLCGSGALSGLAGGIWLAVHGSAPIPVRPIGDLRIPAAAILAGATLFAGPGRTALVALTIAPALLVSTVWRVQVAHLPGMGFQLQMVLLIGMTIVAYLAVVHADRAGRAGRWRTVLSGCAVALTFAGIIILAMAAEPVSLPARMAFQAGGVTTWLAGAVMLLFALVLRR